MHDYKLINTGTAIILMLIFLDINHIGTRGESVRLSDSNSMSSRNFNYLCNNEPLVLTCKVSNSASLTWRSDGYIGMSKTIAFTSSSSVNGAFAKGHSIGILTANSNDRSQPNHLRNFTSLLLITAKRSISNGRRIIECNAAATSITRMFIVEVSGKV